MEDQVTGHQSQPVSYTALERLFGVLVQSLANVPQSLLPSAQSSVPVMDAFDRQLEEVAHSESSNLQTELRYMRHIFHTVRDRILASDSS